MNFSTDTKRLKLLFPVKPLSLDVLKQLFEFPGNLPAASLVILRTRAAFDRCGGVLTSLVGKSTLYLPCLQFSIHTKKIKIT